MSMSRGPNATRGESGTGWYLPPYGGADVGIWPGSRSTEDVCLAMVVLQPLDTEAY